MALLESGQMYLETIYVLSRDSSTVRSIDVCEHMGFSKPSVSAAMKRLREKEFITMDQRGAIHLTPNGMARAGEIYDRHRLLTAMFRQMGADPRLAEENACRVEHVISPELVELIRRSVEEESQAS